MERMIVQKLLDWQSEPKHKPLLLYGARQVGKTHVLKKFAHTAYRDHLYLNFEDTPSLKHYFETSLSPRDILSKLSIHFNRPIVPEHTLIVFDEVQECENALNSLKYFNEEGGVYHVCAAGSLLGVKVGHEHGFPVGQVSFVHLYPLTFMEYLGALGETLLVDYLQSMDKIESLPEPFHDKLNELLRAYYFTGGMPEAVACYIDQKDFGAVRKIHKDILKSYELDFAKHATKNLSLKISQVWDTLPSQLARENKKFIYSLIRASARARDYEEAIQWLSAAGLIHKIYNVSTPKIPLKAYSDFNVFKIYLLDIGLLNTIADIAPQIILQGDRLFQEFHGSLTENYVTQSLAPHFDTQYYWTSRGTAEVDILFQDENAVFPLEIKSGFSTKNKSLQQYCGKYNPVFSLRTSMRNLKYDGKVLNIPLYLIGEIKRMIKLAKS